MDDDGMKELCMTLIEMSVKDYRNGYLFEEKMFGKELTDKEFSDWVKSPTGSKYIKKHKNTLTRRQRMMEAKHFFLSEMYFLMMPDISGKYVLENIRKIGKEFKPFPTDYSRKKEQGNEGSVIYKMYMSKM